MRFLRRAATPEGEFVGPDIFGWTADGWTGDPAEHAARATTPDGVTPAASRAAAAARRDWPLGADIGLLVARVVLGLVAVLGGARVLFGLPGGAGGGLAATGGMLAGRGFFAVDVLARTLGWAQLVAGILVLLGVFASFAASALFAVAVTAIGVTATAAVTAGTTGPVEGPLLAAGLSVVLAGPGRCAADAGRAWSRQQTAVGLTCGLIGLATGLTVLLAFR